jgi:competence protein ComFC
LNLTNPPLKTVQSIFSYFVDLVFPPACLHCQTIISEPANNLPLCSICYSQLVQMSPDYPKTQILERLKPSFVDQMWIAYEFNEIIQSVIHNIKYRKMPNMGIRIGELCAKVLRPPFDPIKERSFLPVPLHPIRQKERGYNQSKFITKGLINIHSGISSEHALIRNKNTISQTTLNREERQENVHQAFEVRNGVDISGKTIILVDDLITTGATMNECARVLKENGAKRIICVAVASPVNLHLQSL